MIDEITKRKEHLRALIPKTRNGLGHPKTDRLDELDSWLCSRKFSMADLDFIEKEIMNSVEIYRKKQLDEGEEDAI